MTQLHPNDMAARLKQKNKMIAEIEDEIAVLERTLFMRQHHLHCILGELRYLKKIRDENAPEVDIKNILEKIND